MVFRLLIAIVLAPLIITWGIWEYLLLRSLWRAFLLGFAIWAIFVGIKDRYLLLLLIGIGIIVWFIRSVTRPFSNPFAESKITPDQIHRKADTIIEPTQEEKIKEYWSEIKAAKLPNIVPFNGTAFNYAIDRWRNLGTPKLVFIIDCMANDLESDSFKQVLQTLPEERVSDFANPYSSIIFILMFAQVSALGGQSDVEDQLREQDAITINLANRYLNEMVKRIKSDESGTLAMEYLTQDMITRSAFEHFKEGIGAVHDTFMAYSQVFDIFVAGDK